MYRPTILILIGITGDLAQRKLLPAIEGLRTKGLLPEQFKLVGVTRRDDPELFKMDLDNPADYQRLKEYLEGIEKEWPSSAKATAGEGPQRLFYLSVAPTVAMPIIKLLGEAGLATPSTKLLLEKPFGTDLQNGQQLIVDIEKYFPESQVYRIDHYLQKDSVRHLLTVPAFDKSTARELESIEIFAREQIGIEGRADFYEQTGALRDFIQSHLLEVAVMVIDPTDRLLVLKNFYIPSDIMQHVKRGQYKGYREAVEKPESVTETNVSVTLRSHDPLLKDISVTLKTGKALDRKSTDIIIFYKDGAIHVISLNDTSNAYENVFTDAIRGDKTFFVSEAEVLENWRIIDPVQQAWLGSSDDLLYYEQGSIM